MSKTAVTKLSGVALELVRSAGLDPDDVLAVTVSFDRAIATKRTAAGSWSEIVFHGGIEFHADDPPLSVAITEEET